MSEPRPRNSIDTFVCERARDRTMAPKRGTISKRAKATQPAGSVSSSSGENVQPPAESTRVITRQTSASIQPLHLDDEEVESSSHPEQGGLVDLTIRHFTEQKAHDKAKAGLQDAHERVGLYPLNEERMDDEDDQSDGADLPPPPRIDSTEMEEDQLTEQEELELGQGSLSMNEISNSAEEEWGERSQNTIKDEEESGNRPLAVRFFSRKAPMRYSAQERTNAQVHRKIVQAINAIAIDAGQRVPDLISAFRTSIGDAILDEECDYAHNNAEESERHGLQMRTIIELNPEVNLFDLTDTSLQKMANVLLAFCEQQHFFRSDCCPQQSLNDRATQQLNVACGMISALRLPTRQTILLRRKLEETWVFFDNFQKNLIRKNQTREELNAALEREDRGSLSSDLAKGTSSTPQVLDNALHRHLSAFEKRIVERMQRQAREQTERLNAQREWVEQRAFNLQPPGPRASTSHTPELPTTGWEEDSFQSQQNPTPGPPPFFGGRLHPTSERVPSPFQTSMPQVNAPLAELEQMPSIDPLELGGADEGLNLTIGNNRQAQANVLVSLENVPTWEEFIPATDSCNKLLTFIRKCIAKNQDLRTTSWPMLLQLQIASQYRLYLDDLREAGDQQIRPVDWHELSPKAMLSFVEFSAKTTGNKMARTPIGTIHQPNVNSSSDY